MGVVITSARQAHRRWDFCFCSLVAAAVLARVQLLDIVLFFDIVLLAFRSPVAVLLLFLEQWGWFENEDEKQLQSVTADANFSAASAGFNF